MRSRPWVGWLSLGAVLLVTVSARADGDVVEATGEAQVRNGDTVTAKKAATADALKKCIEKVVGIYVQNDFSSEQREIVRDSKDEFYSAVKDSITQKSEGFVQSYEVLGEAQKGDVMQVTVRAKVFESKLRAQVKKLADLIAAAGNPKLMLVVQEIYISPEGNKRVASDSQVAAYLEKALLARGFEIRGATAAKKLADESPVAYDKWLEDAGGAARMARDQGADILIAGRVEIKNKGKIEDAGGLTALVGQVRIEIDSIIRGFNSASGEEISSKPVQMVSVGTTEERAVYRAFQGRGSNVIKQTFEDLLQDLKESFKKTAAEGQSYVVSLRGVKSFRKQGKGFLEVLRKLTGVSAVKQKSFTNGELVIDVAFKGSTSELQERIFSAVEKDAQLGSLDVAGVSGKLISFKL